MIRLPPAAPLPPTAPLEEPLLPDEPPVSALLPLAPPPRRHRHCILTTIRSTRKHRRSRLRRDWMNCCSTNLIDEPELDELP
ncbi:MAG: hypothetical protein R3A10_17790 [Caldilineaceae bacterium]